jgi:hypothetical protein
MLSHYTHPELHFSQKLCVDKNFIKGQSCQSEESCGKVCRHKYPYHVTPHSTVTQSNNISILILYAPQSPDMISWIKKYLSDMNKYGKNPDNICIPLISQKVIRESTKLHGHIPSMTSCNMYVNYSLTLFSIFQNIFKLSVAQCLSYPDIFPGQVKASPHSSHTSEDGFLDTIMMCRMLGTHKLNYSNDCE